MLLERLPEHIARAEADAARYADAAPFPHIVIDDFLDAGTLAQAMAEFPAPEQVSETRPRSLHALAGAPGRSMSARNPSS